MMRKLAFLLLLGAASIGFAGPQSAAKQASSTAASASSSPKSALLDINTASAEELDALPGIGPAFAKKIIAGRPYKQKGELVSKGVIPESTYAKIKSRVVAHQVH